MVRYVLNSAVITAPGTYVYGLIDLDAARAWLTAPCGICLHSSGEMDHLPCRDCEGTGRQPFISTVGYVETAEALADLTGVAIPINRQMIAMKADDEALVFRLNFPPGTPRLTPQTKGLLSPEFILAHCEIGLLKRSE